MINNGAAGMQNLHQQSVAIITRIGVQAYQGDILYRCQLSAIHIEALSVKYPHQAFCEAFLSLWPVASAAHCSYFERINSGTNLHLNDATGCEFKVS